MSDRLCPSVSKECLPCNDDPLLNRSSEDPDPTTCFGLRHYERVPPLAGRTTQVIDCGLIICETLVFGSDPCKVNADYCTLIKALNCGGDTNVSDFTPPCPGSIGCTDRPGTPNDCNVAFGHAVNGSGQQALPADTKRFVRFTVPTDLTVVQSLNFYLNRTATGAGYAVAAGIYTDASGVPDALVANSYIALTADLKRADPLWYTATYTGIKPAITAGGIYWVGIITLLPIITYHDAGEANQQASAGDTYFDGLANPFGTPAYDSLEMSCYVCYKTGIYNTRQCATDTCDDGSLFEFCVEAGEIPGINQAAADAQALSIAQNQVRLRKICLPSIGEFCCLGQAYNQTINATGASVAAPAVNLWQLVDGMLPTGLVFNGGFIPGGASITGVPTDTGTFPFQIKVTAPNGSSNQKSYSIQVLGITTTDPLPDATPNTLYSVSILISGFVGTPTWTLLSGTLPTGLTLNSVTGAISGTPTVQGDFTFTIAVTDGVNSCSKTFHLASFTFSAFRLNAWKQWCGFDDLRNTQGYASENVPPPVYSYCNSKRWLVMTVRDVWNNAYDCTTHGLGTSPYVVDDTWVYKINRYNCTDNPQGELISESHLGTCVGNPYDQALACTGLGCGIDQMLQWLVSTTGVEEDHYRIDIKFTVHFSGATFEGYHEVTLSDPYTLTELQSDLVALWSTININDYTWPAITKENPLAAMDILATYSDTPDPNKPENRIVIQYAPDQPTVVPSTGAINDVAANRYCRYLAGDPDYIGQSITPPLVPGLDVDTYTYHGGYLFNEIVDGEGGANPFQCVNLVKTIMRYKGMYCQRDIPKALPLSNPTSGPSPRPPCDPDWGTPVLTPKISTTFSVPLVILPIPGAAPFTPGISTVIKDCQLLEWWAQEQLNATPRLGSLYGTDTQLICAVAGAGSIDDVPGLINLGTELVSTDDVETQTLESGLVNKFPYNGLYDNGVSITGWFKVTQSFDASLDNFTAELAYTDTSKLTFLVQGSLAVVQIDIFGVGAISVSVPFIPSVGGWVFFRAFYDSVNLRVGIQLNNGIVTLSGLTGTLTTNLTGNMSVRFTSGTVAQTAKVIVDELAVWGVNISNETATFLYNGGVGRTYPFV